MKDNDELIGVKKINDNDLILLGSSSGKVVKFDEQDIRPMGRTASGVRGINNDGGITICSEVVNEDNKILIVTEKGYGKITNVSEFRQTKRGSKGVKALNITEKNGMLIDIKVVGDNMDVILMSNTGMTMKMPLSQISTLGRATQGLRLINLKDDQKVATVSLVEEEETISEDSENPTQDN